MSRLLHLALVTVAGLGVSSCSSEPDDCTEFASTGQSIGIQHASGLAPVEGGVDEPRGDDPVLLGELVAGDGDDRSAASTVTVYQSGSLASDEVDWYASRAIRREVSRAGIHALAIEPYPTTEVSLDGMTAYRSELATDDGAVYTAWVVPGEEHSLDIVLRQGEDALAEENLADDLPDLVSAGGCA